MGAGDEIRGMAARLNDAPTRAVDLIRQATVKATTDTQAEARRRAPVDTGYLRSSITARHGAQGSTVFGVIEAGANYAAYVEHGTSRAGPQPFMRPATELHAPKWQAAIEQIGGKAL